MDSKVTAQDPRTIQSMFGKISHRYDLANTVLSFGIHHLWKKRLVKASQIAPGQAVLDCATGTGDLAFLFEKEMSKKGRVVGSDFCEPMLKIAADKAKNSHSIVHFEFADLMNLPYSNHEFDAASISFGIRNVKNTQKALSELARVVRPGGRVLVLEFGQPRSQILSFFYSLYSRYLLPFLGGCMSGDFGAYQYLQTSSAVFPCGNDFLNIAKSTGAYTNCAAQPLFSGVAYLYVLQTNA